MRANSALLLACYRGPTSCVDKRGATFACMLGTPCAFMAADGGDHLPLCRYNAVYGIARTSGAVSMTAPNLGCLEAPGIVPHASLLAIQIESYGRARSPVRVFGGLCVFAAQVPHCHCAELLLCGFTVYARMGRGGGCCSAIVWWTLAGGLPTWLGLMYAVGSANERCRRVFWHDRRSSGATLLSRRRKSVTWAFGR